jgi:hypothetical protein
MEAYFMVISNPGEGQSSFAENRLWRRYKCNIESCCFSRERRWECKIVDLSERGMGIATTSSIKKGTIVNFTDPLTRAMVVWSAENRAGLKIIN